MVRFARAGLLYHHRPRQFLIDARTQISETRTGRSLKRGYYPPDQKPLADSCRDSLVR